MTGITPRELLEDAVKQADLRTKHITDPQIDGVVKALCERFGYGAVMDSAMRQWIKKDEVGAIITIGCLSICRAALDNKESK